MSLLIALARIVSVRQTLCQNVSYEKESTVQNASGTRYRLSDHCLRR